MGFLGDLRTHGLSGGDFLSDGSIPMTGPLALDDGTAAAPSLINYGDTNTGLWFPAADKIAISTGGTERFRIDTSNITVSNSNLTVTGGNVGIGMVPIYALDVAGASRINLTDAGPAFTFSRTGATTASWGVGGLAGGDFRLYRGSGSGDILFGVNQSSVADGSNVGIGVTPESWASSRTVIQFGGLGALWGLTAATVSSSSYFSQNVYNDGTSKYIIADDASEYGQVDGTHSFYVAGAGAADAAITWKNPWSTTLSGAAGAETITHVFKTSSSGTEATALTLDGLQNIYGKTGTTGMTNGFIFIPAAAGAPSGTPGITTTTLSPMYFDSTNDALYVYDNVDDAWLSVALT